MANPNLVSLQGSGCDSNEFTIDPDAGPIEAPALNDGTLGTPTSCAGGEPPDPFDPARLRLSQNFGADLGVKKALLTIPVRKPSKEAWVRVHPDAAYRMETYVVELKEEGETYLVDPSLWSELAGEATFSRRALHSAINRQGVLFVWPTRLPDSSGKLDAWSQSAIEAVGMARTQWVRVAANMNLGAYDVFTSAATLPEPNWPDISFREILRVGFKGRLIDTLDHPVLTRLRGEA